MNLKYKCYTCFFVVFRVSVLFVIFSLFLQSNALHNARLPSTSRFPNNRRTWRYQPQQYSRTLSPERLQRFRQMANPRRLSERRPTVDTRRRFRQMDRTRDQARDRRRNQTPRIPSVPRSTFSQSRRMNPRGQSQRVSTSNAGYFPRINSNIRKGRFTMATPRNKVLHIRLKKNNQRGTNQVTPRPRAQGPLVYKTKPAYAPLVKSRTLAPKPSPRLVHRKVNRKGSRPFDPDKIENFVVDLTKDVRTVTPNQPMVLTNNVKSSVNSDGPTLMTQGKFETKKKVPLAPFVRPIILPKPVTITQTPRISGVLNPPLVANVPKIANSVPIPKIPDTPTILIKNKLEVTNKNHLKPDTISEQNKASISSPFEPRINLRNDKKRPLYILVRRPGGQYSGSFLQRNEDGSSVQTGPSPILVKTNNHNSINGDNIQSGVRSTPQQSDINVFEKPLTAKPPELIKQQHVLVTNRGIPTTGNFVESRVGPISNSEVVLSSKLANVETVVKKPVAATVTVTQNNTVDLQDIVNFINQIRSGDINSLNIPPTLKTLITPTAKDQALKEPQPVEEVAVSKQNLNNVPRIEPINNKPKDDFNTNLKVIRDFVEQLKAGPTSLIGNQNTLTPSIINPTIQSRILNQQMGSLGLMNQMPSPGLMNPYLPGVQSRFNPMAVGGWDGSSANVPLVMQQAGITHGSQLSAMMQEMMFGDSVDPPDPTATASSGGEIEIEDVPTTVQPKRNKRMRKKKRRRQRMRFRPTPEKPFMDTTTYSSFDFSVFDNVVSTPSTPSSSTPSTTPATTTTTRKPIHTTIPPSTQSANDVAISLARKLIALASNGDSAASDIFKSLNIDVPQIEATVTPINEEKDNNQILPDASANEENPAPAKELPSFLNSDQETFPQLDPQPPTEAVLDSFGISSEHVENFQNIKDSLLSDVSLPGDSNTDLLSMSSFLSANDIGGVKIEKIRSDLKASLDDESLPTVQPTLPTDSETLKEAKISEQFNEIAASNENAPTVATTEQPFESVTVDFKDDESPTVATTEQPFEAVTSDLKELVRSKLQRYEDEPLIAGFISMFNNFDSPADIIRNVNADVIRQPLTVKPTTTTTTDVPTTKLKTPRIVNTTPKPTIMKTTTTTTTTAPTTKLKTTRIVVSTPKTTKMTTTPPTTTLKPANTIKITPITDNANTDKVVLLPPTDDNINNIYIPEASSGEFKVSKSPLEMLVGLLSELKSAIIPKSPEVPLIPVITTTTTQLPPTTTPPKTTTTTTATIKTTSKPTAKPERPGCTPFHPGFQCRGKDIFASVQNTGKWCVETCRQKGCVTKVCECNCNRKPPPNRFRNRGHPNWRRPSRWQNRMQNRRRGRNLRRKKPKPTTKEPPEEIEAEDMPSTTTTEMMTTTEYYDYTYGFYSDNSQTTPGYLSGNYNNNNKGTHGEVLPQLDWASDPNLDVSRFSGNDWPATTESPNSEWMGSSRPPPSWRGTAWELPPAPIKKKKKQNSEGEGEEGTTQSPKGWTPQPTGWSSGSDRSWGRESNWQQGGWNQPPQNRWNNGPRFNGGSRDTWREPIGNNGRGSWNDPPPFNGSGDQWRRNMFGIRRSVDSGFRLRNSWRNSKSKNKSGSGGEEQET